MFSDFDFGVVARSLPYLLKEGLTFTLTLTALATIGGVILGTLIAMMRLSSYKVLQLVGAGYVNLLRSLPLVLVIFWFYFLVPYVLQWSTRASSPVPVGAFASALITFTIFEAAYFSEIMRAGIQSIPRGQPQAASAIGMNYWQSMRYVILPQAFRNMLPVILTQTIILFQDTSLVYVVSLPDFLGAASKVAQRDGRLVEMYIFAALVYFAISFCASRLVAMLQARFKNPSKSRFSVSITFGPVPQGFVLGAALGALVGLITRPNVPLLGIKIPLSVLFSSNPLDALFRGTLIEHLSIWILACGLVGGIGFWLFGCWKKSK